MKASTFLIGLTGNIASGKSTVGKILLEHGFPVIEADRIGWKILEREEVKKEITASIGDCIEKDKIERKRLGRLVFSDKGLLRKLNSIVHPPLIDELQREIEHTKNSVIVLNAALLFEWGIEGWCDVIILVMTDRESRIKRLMESNLTKEEAIQRIDSQIPDETKRNRCDYVIENTSTLENLTEKVLAIIPHLPSPDHIGN
jgi:dephospho-CoA kinase